MITVTKLYEMPPMMGGGLTEDPLNALRELDAAVAERWGRIHEHVMGFDYQSGCYMSRQEFVVCVNPPELPA